MRTLPFTLCLLGLVAGGKKEAAPAASSSGTVAVTADGDGFKPNAVTFAKGSPAKLVFTRTSDETCATEVVFPELGLKKELPKNQPVTVDIPTDKAQKLTFQCGMGMYKSAVVIASQ
jgi:plastocyanin domain-containing protein